MLMRKAYSLLPVFIFVCVSIFISPVYAEARLYAIQIGAFQNEDNAVGLVTELKNQRYNAYLKKLPSSVQAQKIWNMVYVGNFGSESQARQEAGILKQKKIITGSPIIKVLPDLKQSVSEEKPILIAQERTSKEAAAPQTSDQTWAPVAVKPSDEEEESETKSTVKSNYVMLKGGIFIPGSKDLQGFSNGFNGEVALGHYFNQYFATELGVGYYQSSTSTDGSYSYNDLTASGGGRFDIRTIPLTLALKAIYPFDDRFEIYALGGLGAYFANAKLDLNGTVTTSKGTPNSSSYNCTTTKVGGFLGAGANLNFDNNWFIGAEGKYLWVGSSFDFTFEGNNWTERQSIQLNMSGLIVTGNVGHRF